MTHVFAARAELYQRGDQTITSTARYVAMHGLDWGAVEAHEALLVTQRFDALKRASALKAPALFMHGTADRFVPPAMSQRLFEAAPQPKQLHLIEGYRNGNGRA